MHYDRSVYGFREKKKKTLVRRETIFFVTSQFYNHLGTMLALGHSNVAIITFARKIACFMNFCKKSK